VRRPTAARLLPPILLDAYRKIAERLSRKPPEYEYVSDDSFPPSTTMNGWNVESVSNEQMRKWDRLVELTSGTGPLGIDPHAPVVSNTDYRAHNALMTFGYVLVRSAGGRDSVSVLDWGSGPGQYYVFARALLPGVAIDYHGVDVPLLCEAGRRAVPEATFHDDDSAFDRQYDLVMASGALQYAEDWRDTLGKLAGAASRSLYLVVPVVRHANAFVIVQRPHKYGYLTEFVQWVFNRDELVAAAESSGLTLRREFLNEEMGPIRGTPERRATVGFLFER
jgi:putative methyltransferase (TIGR04325 family)